MSKRCNHKPLAQIINERGSIIISDDEPFKVGQISSGIFCPDCDDRIDHTFSVVRLVELAEANEQFIGDGFILYPDEDIYFAEVRTD